VRFMKKMLPATFERLLSDRVGDMAGDIQSFKDSYARLWKESECSFPAFKKSYTEKEQIEIEENATAFFDELTAKISQLPTEKDQQSAWIETCVQGLKEKAKDLLHLSSVSIDPDFERGFVRTTREFIEQLKIFDPELRIENVYQALRNVWIMNSLQIYLDLPIEHTDAIFAYSLIYPYTDNYLDDVSLSMENKINMMLDLRGWLEGKRALSEFSDEEKIHQLIRLIEAQYERERYPEVYQSLLAIFNGQIRSLIQQKKIHRSLQNKILEISLEKGGASVLADGYLVKGQLDCKEADFCFGFGLFLQLADDIQDIAEDRKNNHMTLFSGRPRHQKRNDLANRLFHFIKDILDLKLEETSEKRKKLKRLILDNCSFLILEAIGKNRSFFSKSYVAQMEIFFPVRYTFLKSIRQKIKDRLLAKNKAVIDLDFVSAALLAIASRTVL
jgi:hypothetical protein